VALLLGLIVTVVVVEWFRRTTYRASAHIEIVAEDEGNKEGTPPVKLTHHPVDRGAAFAVDC
jgi:hypothetical protein